MSKVKVWITTTDDPIGYEWEYDKPDIPTFVNI